MTGNRAILYVDAWNLFYGALSRTRYKWLDLRAMAELMLPDHEIVGIKYYSALLLERPGEEHRLERQKTYLRALRTVPGLEIQFGQFRSHVTRLPLADAADSDTPEMVQVLKTEEKRTDVNLATHMVHDAHCGAFDLAVLVSNDSDLAEPLKIVRDDVGLDTAVLNPHAHPVREIERNASFIKPITHRHLARCQFPDAMMDDDGPFRRPDGW